ncbi:hypothetical protein Tco_0057369, partial [Tanacetum coccineum]
MGKRGTPFSFSYCISEQYGIWLFHLGIRGISILGMLKVRVYLLAELGGNYLRLEACMGLHTDEEIESVGFSAYWAESTRQIPDKGDLSADWIGISFAGDFLSITPSYTSIRDHMLRLCHRLIA